MKLNKKIGSVLMLLCLLAVSLSTSLQAVHAKGSDEKTNYVAFGDSIAAGYGLDGYSDDQAAAPADSYQALAAKFLHTQSSNYAVSGDNSDDCIQLLNSGKADKDLAKADIITISIGSNDLLLPFIQILTDYFQIDPAALDPALIQEQIKNGFTMPQLDPSKMAEYYKQAEELLNLLSDHAALHAQADAFHGKFQTILSILHEKAPDAEIYATNVYNPFAFLPKIGELADIYIREINQAFSADAPDYTLVDVYTPFHEQELTNVHVDLLQLSSFNLDPHPSVQGHAVIGELITAAFQNAHAPKTAVLRSLSSGSKKKLTVKVKLPADADGYQILYSASKNGKYQTLKNTDKKTFQTNSKKLKLGKTYYIKVRSFRTIKGVTYYGKDSGLKKVTIK